MTANATVIIDQSGNVVGAYPIGSNPAYYTRLGSSQDPDEYIRLLTASGYKFVDMEVSA